MAVVALLVACQAAMTAVKADATPAARVTVAAAAGPVVGRVGDGVRRFEGIPYAAPPVGELRWRSPRPAAPWDEPRDATRPGSPCAQAAGIGPVDVAAEHRCGFWGDLEPAA